MKTLKKVLPRAAAFFLVFTLICGVAYPLLITVIGQLFFRDKANGSMVEVGDKKYGCELLGQQFTGDEYLWGRIMNVDTETFTGSDGRPAVYAWASNLSPASEEYEALVAERVEKIKAAHPGEEQRAVPVDLVTCSGSGLDPHISPAAAEYQVGRLAAVRGLSENDVRGIIKQYTDGRLLGIFGEPRVNVLKVNLALDGILK